MCIIYRRHFGRHLRRRLLHHLDITRVLRNLGLNHNGYRRVVQTGDIGILPHDAVLLTAKECEQ